MRKKVKLASAIIIGVLFFCAVLGTTFHLLIVHINKNDPNATTTTTSSLSNLYTTSGAIDPVAAKSILSAVGYWGRESDTGTYTAHNIASRGTSGSDNTVIFPMGYYVDASGNMATSKPILWQATYLWKGYLTVWMNTNYVIDYFYSGTSTNSGFGNGTSYLNHSNYSKSTLRDVTNNIYTKLSGKLANFSTIIKSPSSAKATWQTTQADDVHTYATSYYDHHNNLDDYNGEYQDWSHDNNWNTSDTPYNDEFWIPSSVEVFNKTARTTSTTAQVDNGLWGLTAADRGFNTTTIKGNGTTTKYCWLRSGYSISAYSAMLVVSSGSAIYSDVSGSRGVRPAAHISLSTLATYAATTVTLDQQGGSGGTESVDASGGSAMPSITIPTRTGYTFGGYYTSTNGGGTQYYTATGASATNYPSSGGPTTLYAKWTGNTYYVKYNANGGSGTMSNSTHTYGTASALTTNAFTRTGYSFSGWATSSTGAVEYSNGASVSTLTTTSGGTYNLYAVWTLNSYTITLKTNDNNLGSVTGGGTLNYGTEQTFIAITASGCGFMYWIDGSGNTYTANPLTITISGDATFTAIFTNGVMDGIACMAEAGGEVRMNGYNDSDTTIHFSAVAYAGYTFDGWYIYGESTALSTEWSVDLEKSTINNKLIVAKFSETNAQVNTETNNTGNLT